MLPPAAAPKAPACAPRTTAAASPSAPARARKLGELPDANSVLAVLVTVDGCPYQVITRFKVSSPGPFYARGVLAPAGGGGVEPARPTSDGR